jgi:hypothetical protein
MDEVLELRDRFGSGVDIRRDGLDITIEVIGPSSVPNFQPTIVVANRNRVGAFLGMVNKKKKVGPDAAHDTKNTGTASGKTVGTGGEGTEGSKSSDTGDKDKETEKQ